MTRTRPHSIVAAFDFDNTLINRDSLVPFLNFIKGRWKTYFHLLILTPSFIAYLAGRISRQQIKEKILTRCLKGTTFKEIQSWGKRFADQELDHYIIPKALQSLRWHQSQGHRCILVSASLEIYLMPWAERYGIETVLGSRLEFTEDEKMTGKLEGQNCWGPEKMYRLLAYLGPKENYQLYSYGDSQGDREMLEMADYSFYRSFT